MKNMVSLKKASLMMVASLLISNSTPTYAIPSGKHLAVAAGLAATARLICKADPAKDAITTATLPDFFRKLADALTHGEAKEVAYLLAKFGDDFIIGYSGKASGPRAAGEAITLEGTDVVQTKFVNGQEIALIYKEGAPCYGIMGTGYLRLDAFTKKMNVINEFCKLCTKGENVTSQVYDYMYPAEAA